MKQLFILRHAQALGTQTGGTDKTRPLSPKGHEDAKALGGLMAREGLQPDQVLCSSATRTCETLDGVMESLSSCKIEYMDRLYNADFDALLGAIREVSSDIERVLLVAHNPGVHTLAARLSKDDESAAVDRLMMSYAPATLSVLECAHAEWGDVAPYAQRLVSLHEAVEYNSSDRPTRWM